MDAAAVAAAGVDASRAADTPTAAGVGQTKVACAWDRRLLVGTWAVQRRADTWGAWAAQWGTLQQVGAQERVCWLVDA